MTIELKEITIHDLIEGYANDGYGGRLSAEQPRTVFIDIPAIAATLQSVKCYR